MSSGSATTDGGALPTHVVATAGHVDHGKSTLVRVLTGSDPDRWPEEKHRGLTIDLGFAWCRLPSGRALSFVDVPGHIRFLRNMLAGVGAVDAAVLVVDVGEGWMPQTEEHLRILEALGIRHGIVVLSKVATVERDLVDLATLELEERLAGTFLAGADIVATDALTGDGLPELNRALDRLADATPRAHDRGRPRLWVDRSFAARGSGTVVTGTLTGGALHVDDEVEVGDPPRRARVRALQTHGHPITSAAPGCRLAVNLAGIGHAEVARGDAVVAPGRWHRTSTIDAGLDVLAALDHEVSRRGAYIAYIGSGDVPVRLRVLGRDALAPGSGGAVRLHLARPLPLVPGDRFVLRDSGRDETIGGGEVLDVDPVLPAAVATPDRSVERVVRERGWVRTGDLERLTGQSVAPTVDDWVVDPEAWSASVSVLEAEVDDAGPLGLDVSVLDVRARAVLGLLDGIEVDEGRARRSAASDPLANHHWLADLDAAPFAPPPPHGVDSAEVRQLVRRGIVVEESGVHFSAAAVGAASGVVAGLLISQPDGVTVAQIRDALGTTRRYVIPLVTILDRSGITRRRGDLRIAGPRLPPPPADQAS
ncbi:MAG TPA: selenocysteine-specific translation elongation factor [Acidimicrobiales bacterium]